MRPNARFAMRGTLVPRCVRLSDVSARAAITLSRWVLLANLDRCGGGSRALLQHQGAFLRHSADVRCTDGARCRHSKPRAYCLSLPPRNANTDSAMSFSLSMNSCEP